MNNENYRSNLLSVDNLQRPRANSDPGIFTLPEIIVQDCSSGDAVTKKLSEIEDDDYFSFNACMRPRSNTCPEDLFHQRPERPGTPPPILEKRHQRHGRFNFVSPSKTCVSFAHHNLSNISEDEGPETVIKYSAKRQLKSGVTEQMENKFNKEFEIKLNLKGTRQELNFENS
ncbi:hypothetical protein LOTGIDRAFT_166165 [Lottia gigantea]|uniref:Uncharacterized protein n=1 Tax=Lottia gigantea TaxID=225164 RepID=V4BH59_LOTGI|nr:hypothetical protein LOTGIDRAFT_166165 [Lottia gigantea]ESO87864.1 hypothetical protein LOTGIDRAFT_166165 [Lottia gigantea]